MSENKPKSDFGTPSYGITRSFEKEDFAAVMESVRESLAKEGFGVLTEIDVRATLKKKIDVEFQDYVILGACNPKLAHEALQEEIPVGLLLPCNVVVTRNMNNTVVVSAIDPVEMFAVVKRPDVEPLAKEVKTKLERAIESI